MSMLKKSLMAVVAVCVVAPTAAFALPSPQCDEICRPNRATCETECWVHLVPTTCGDAGYYWCVSNDTPTVSVTDAAAQQAEDAPVCREEHAAEVQPVSVES